MKKEIKEMLTNRTSKLTLDETRVLFNYIARKRYRMKKKERKLKRMHGLKPEYARPKVYKLRLCNNENYGHGFIDSGNKSRTNKNSNTFISPIIDGNNNFTKFKSEENYKCNKIKDFQGNNQMDNASELKNLEKDTVYFEDKKSVIDGEEKTVNFEIDIEKNFKNKNEKKDEIQNKNDKDEAEFYEERSENLLHSNTNHENVFKKPIEEYNETRNEYIINKNVNTENIQYKNKKNLDDEQGQNLTHNKIDIIENSKKSKKPLLNGEIKVENFTVQDKNNGKSADDNDRDLNLINNEYIQTIEKEVQSINNDDSKKFNDDSDLIAKYTEIFNVVSKEQKYNYFFDVRSQKEYNSDKSTHKFIFYDEYNNEI